MRERKGGGEEGIRAESVLRSPRDSLAPPRQLCFYFEDNQKLSSRQIIISPTAAVKAQALHSAIGVIFSNSNETESER